MYKTEHQLYLKKKKKYLLDLKNQKYRQNLSLPRKKNLKTSKLSRIENRQHVKIFAT